MDDKLDDINSFIMENGKLIGRMLFGVMNVMRCITDVPRVTHDLGVQVCHVTLFDAVTSHLSCGEQWKNI